MCVCAYMYIYVYIHIYIYRERHKDRDRETEREGQRKSNRQSGQFNVKKNSKVLTKERRTGKINSTILENK